MSAIKTYRDLQVWQRAMDLAKGIYLSTQAFPKAEQFGLAHQLTYLASTDTESLLGLCNKIERMLNTILTKLQAPR